jgi:hypothetical protein
MVNKISLLISEKLEAILNDLGSGKRVQTTCKHLHGVFQDISEGTELQITIITLESL